MSAAKKNSSNFIKQGSILAVASIVSRLIGLVYRIPMANILGNEGNGIYSVAFEIYSLALILSSYSLPLAVSKLVSARFAKKEYRNAYKIFRSTMIFAMISGGIMALLIFFGAEFLENTIYSQYEGVFIPLRILAPTIFISAVMGVLRGFYQGKNTMMPTAFSQVLEQIVNGFVSVYGSITLMKAHSASKDIAAWGAAGGTLGTTTGAFAGLAFLLFVYFLYRPIIKKQIKRDTSESKESYKEVYTILFLTIAPVILSQTVYQISGVLDSIFFGKLMGAKGIAKLTVRSAYGIYSANYRLLVNVPIAISSAIAASMIPTLVGSFTNGNLLEVKEKVGSAVKFNMLLAFPSAVGMAVIARPIVQMLFPSIDYITGGKLILYGSSAIIFFALSTVTSAVLQGINRMRLPVIHSAISLGIHIIIIVLLLHFTNLGLYALVIGNVTYPMVVCALNWIAVGKHLEYHQELKTTFLIPFICSIIMGAITFLVYQGIYLLVHSNTLSTLIALCIAVIVYFVSVILLKGVTEEELHSFPMGRTLTKVTKKLHLM